MNRGYRQEPLYVLPYDIEVICESFSGRYVMCDIRPHLLFPNTGVVYGRQKMQRARIVMTAILGRVLGKNEHVHHRVDALRHTDAVWNLELLDVATHNRHHKLGSRHTAAAKARIGRSVRAAYADGRHARHGKRINGGTRC